MLKKIDRFHFVYRYASADKVCGSACMWVRMCMCACMYVCPHENRAIMYTFRCLTLLFFCFVGYDRDRTIVLGVLDRTLPPLSIRTWIRSRHRTKRRNTMTKTTRIKDRGRLSVFVLFSFSYRYCYYCRLHRSRRRMATTIATNLIRTTVAPMELELVFCDWATMHHLIMMASNIQLLLPLVVPIATHRRRKSNCCSRPKPNTK